VSVPQFDHVTIRERIQNRTGRLLSNQPSVSLGVSAAGQDGIREANGVFAASTGEFTGRSANDKYIVRDAATAETVWWAENRALERDAFDRLLSDMLAAVDGVELFEQQLFAGADRQYRLNVDVFTDSAWHALFIRYLLIRPREDELGDFAADVTILHLPEFQARPDRHGTRSETCIALDFSRNIILICGTAYAGEIKKAVFTLFNFRAPERAVFPMHCSANANSGNQSALFFGLSGTGKTTLSASADRALVGDDEHGWSEQGIFNLEGGCYAKAIGLTEELEPEIFRAAHRPGAILENVVVDPRTGEPDFADASVTENTRIAYPLHFIANRVEIGMAPHPRNVVLLSADAFGVLPPIARLSIDQAVAMFLAGYTAKVAGTERGVTEPTATFSACFGAPFMPRHPSVYARQFAERLTTGGADCWLLNTGWTGGSYGTGQRIELKLTRRMLSAALSGELNAAEFGPDPVFGLDVPVAIEGVPHAVLNPIETWADPGAYRRTAGKLIALFEAHLQDLGHPGLPFAAASSSLINAA